MLSRERWRTLILGRAEESLASLTSVSRWGDTRRKVTEVLGWCRAALSRLQSSRGRRWVRPLVSTSQIVSWAGLSPPTSTTTSVTTHSGL